MAKILHVNFSFTLGGLEVLMLALAERMMNNGFPSEILIINEFYDKDMMLKLEQANIPCHTLNRPVGNSFFRNWQYLRSTVNILRFSNYDIIHCHNVAAVVWIFLAKIISLKKCRLVLTLHNTNFLRRTPSHFLISHMVKKIVAISRSVLMEIDNVNSKKGVLIYNGVALDKFTQKPRPEVFGDPIVLGNVARLKIDQKGQDILVRAVAKLIQEGINVECWLIGEDLREGTQKKYLEELAASMNVASAIKFKGKQMDIDSMLNCVDIFILPSRWEGFGLVLIEAMAKGIPVIASDLDGPREIVTSGENGYLFPAGDVESLSNRIKEIINDRGARKRISRAAMERAAFFSMTNMVDRYRELYLSLL